MLWSCPGLEALGSLTQGASLTQAVSVNSIISLLHQDHVPPAFYSWAVSTSTITCTLAHVCTFRGRGSAWGI